MIYEICDTSDDEMYYTIGFFGSLERAKKEIQNKMLNGFVVSSHTQSNYEKIEVFEVGMGWGDNRKLVYTVERELINDKWVTV